MRNQRMSLTDRRTFLRQLGTASAAAMTAGPLTQLLQAAGSSGKRPNIIVMLADDLGYGDVGCYGCPDIKTPNIDRLAAEGVRFTDAYASAPVCSPTRVAFVTGRYQQRLGHTYEDYMGSGIPGVDPAKHPTVAMHMKAAGYQTACFGKWNVAGDEKYFPIHHGFDEWVGMDHNHNYFSHLGYDHATGKWNGELRMWQNDKRENIDGYTTDILGDRTVDYIGRADTDKPFFIYLPWQAPHSPLQPPDAKYANADEVASASKDCRPEMRPDYIKIVERLDYQVGRVMQALKDKGVDDNTLVFFTSDNGGHRTARNLPCRGWKQDLDEGGIRVPMIMRFPGVIPAGTVSEQMAITFDMTATALVAGQADVPCEFRLDGIDLLPIASGVKASDKQRTLYWRRRTVSTHAGVDKVRGKAIRKGPWKYHHDVVRNQEHLYHLGRDLGVSDNLIEMEPEIAELLRRDLEAWEAAVSPQG